MRPAAARPPRNGWLDRRQVQQGRRLYRAARRFQDVLLAGAALAILWAALAAGGPAGGQGRPGGRPGGHSGGGFRGKPAPAEPTTFEDRLKQFMASSDSKLSELRQSERRSSRRGGRR